MLFRSKDTIVLEADEVEGTWTFDIPEYGIWTLTSTLNGDTATSQVDVYEVKQYRLNLQYPHIYGAEWDGTSTTVWMRTDEAAGFTDPVPAVNNGTGSSPFDNLLPWSGMTRITDSVAGELVAIPKF